MSNALITSISCCFFTFVVFISGNITCAEKNTAASNVKDTSDEMRDLEESLINDALKATEEDIRRVQLNSEDISEHISANDNAIALIDTQTEEDHDSNNES